MVFCNQEAFVGPVGHALHCIHMRPAVPCTRGPRKSTHTYRHHLRTCSCLHAWRSGAQAHAARVGRTTASPSPKLRWCRIKTTNTVVVACAHWTSATPYAQISYHCRLSVTLSVHAGVATWCMPSPACLHLHAERSRHHGAGPGWQDMWACQGRIFHTDGCWSLTMNASFLMVSQKQHQEVVYCKVLQGLIWSSFSQAQRKQCGAVSLIKTTYIDLRVSTFSRAYNSPACHLFHIVALSSS